MLSYFFNIDIKGKIKKNLLDYQYALSDKADKILRDKNFNKWLNNDCLKENNICYPSFFLRLEFNNLYFNYQLNKLINESEKIMSRDFDKIKTEWLNNYTDKFWFLNDKMKKGENLTQDEFDVFFDSKKTF
jgi:hypothetical protein